MNVYSIKSIITTIISPLESFKLLSVALASIDTEMSVLAFIVIREIHVTIKSKVSQNYSTLMVGRQFLTLQFVYLGHCRQEGLPGRIAKLLCVVVLTYPLQQGVVPTASIVVGVVPSNTGNQGRSKSKESRNSVPAGTERATFINQYVPIILLCEIFK
jgi:hypothetical protein